MGRNSIIDEQDSIRWCWGFCTAATLQCSQATPGARPAPFVCPLATKPRTECCPDMCNITPPRAWKTLHVRVHWNAFSFAGWPCLGVSRRVTFPPCFPMRVGTNTRSAKFNDDDIGWAWCVLVECILFCPCNYVYTNNCYKLVVQWSFGLFVFKGPELLPLLPASLFEHLSMGQVHHPATDEDYTHIFVCVVAQETGQSPQARSGSNFRCMWHRHIVAGHVLPVRTVSVGVRFLTRFSLVWKHSCRSPRARSEM